MTITIILLIIALILCLMAAINWPNPSPVALGWLGLFFFILSHLVGGYVK
jgi:hypothetical protein